MTPHSLLHRRLGRWLGRCLLISCLLLTIASCAPASNVGPTPQATTVFALEGTEAKGPRARSSESVGDRAGPVANGSQWAALPIANSTEAEPLPVSNDSESATRPVANGTEPAALPVVNSTDPEAPSVAPGLRSPGCAAPLPGPLPLSLEIAGVQRTLIARVPEGYRHDRLHDLVVAFHGRTNSNAQVQRYMDLDETLPEAITAYPAALPQGSGFSWSDPGDPPEALRDFELVEALVESLAATYCIDLDRVFVAGHSLGASFANAVACHRPALVRAVASVAGGSPHGECSGPVAALIIHHPEDRLVPFAEGERTRDAFIAANGHAVVPTAATEPELAELNCLIHGGTGLPVIFCPHDDATTHGGRYYPHNWPDGAADAIARFLQGLPPARGGVTASAER